MDVTLYNLDMEESTMQTIIALVALHESPKKAREIYWVAEKTSGDAR